MKDNEKTRYRATRMGYVFQSYNLLPVLTVLENVEMPLLVSRTKASQAREQAETAIEMVGLADWRTHYPSELSGGQQQRVAIARALVNAPEIVWADEPTGNLDTENSNAIMDLLSLLEPGERVTPSSSSPTPMTWPRGPTASSGCRTARSPATRECLPSLAAADK